MFSYSNLVFNVLFLTLFRNIRDIALKGKLNGNYPRYNRQLIVKNMLEIPIEVETRKAYLNSDNIRIGQNIRRWYLRRKKQYPETNLSYVSWAAGIHPGSISRILRGYGVSEKTLLKIAEAIKVHPGRFLVGIEHWEKYPNVSRYKSKSPRNRRTEYGKPIRSIDTLLLSDDYLRTFVGGVYDEDTLNWTRSAIYTIKEVTRKQRELYLEATDGQLPATY